MADLTIYSTDLDGVVLSYAACAGGGDTFDNDGKTMLHVKNGDASDKVVTVTSRVACNQGQTHHSETTVSAGSEAMIGPFPIDRFTDPSNGKASISYDDVTNLTIAAIRVDS